MNKKKSKCVSYNKWAYIFLIPFFAVFCVFQLIPLVSTVYNSFFENYRAGLDQIGPNFIGLSNYVTLFHDGDLIKYFSNTMILWVLGFIPQIFFSLLLASWFTDLRLRLKCTGFFKTVIYLPNVIMASAFAMLFFTLFCDSGPVNQFLVAIGLPQYRFTSEVVGNRGLICLMNFLMWFGNTTIVLMAAIMGIDDGLFEAARIDGANSWKIFTKITLPLIKPILAYTLITSLIGGLQMFDVPQVLTNGFGNPNMTSMTMIMNLNKYLYSKNYGMGGALSVILFVITAILSVIVFKSLNVETGGSPKTRKHHRKGAAA